MEHYNIVTCFSDPVRDICELLRRRHGATHAHIDAHCVRAGGHRVLEGVWDLPEGRQPEGSREGGPGAAGEAG